MNTPPATTIRLNEDDRALLEQLKKRFGLSSNTQVIRMALRILSESPVGSAVGTRPPEAE